MGAFRKFSTVVLWILLLGVVGAGFLWFSTRNYRAIDSRSVLPANIAILMECTSFPDLLTELKSDNRIWNELKSAGFFKETINGINFLDSLMHRDSQFREFMGKRLSIAIALRANKSPGFLFCLPGTVRNQEKMVLKILAKELPGFNYSKRRFEGNVIYDLNWRHDSEVLNFRIMPPI